MKFFELLQHCKEASAQWNSIKISHHALRTCITMWNVFTVISVPGNNEDHYWVVTYFFEFLKVNSLHFIAELDKFISYICIFRCEITSRFCAPRIIDVDFISDWIIQKSKKRLVFSTKRGVDGLSCK